MLLHLLNSKSIGSNKFPVFLMGFLIIALFGSCQNESRTKPAEAAHDTFEVEDPEQRIGHMVLQVSDLEKSKQFYEDVLHMKTSEEAVYDDEKRIFLSATDSHHEVVLKEGLTEKLQTDKRYLQQLAFEVSDQKHLADYYRELEQKGISTELKDNRISWSLYLYDPDSVYIEIYWDIRDQPFGQQKTNGIQQDLTAEQLMDSTAEME